MAMITVVGIGPGNPDLLFEQGKQAIAAADIIIGSERQLSLVPPEKAEQCKLLPKILFDLEIFLKENTSHEIVLLASGDPLTYGIGNWISKRFAPERVRIIPGISSIHYLFSQARISMENCFLTSSHGKDPNYELIFSLPKVGMVTDSKVGPYELAQQALKRGLTRTFLIGENLSYPDEKIRFYRADEVPKEDYDMNVVVILDEG